MPELAASLDAFTTFGALLKYLRKRAQITQRDLALAVGYSVAQISRLEKNQRLPDLTTLAALFVPALHLDHEALLVSRLIALAAEARGERRVTLTRAVRQASVEVIEELGVLEQIPPPPPQAVARPAALARLRDRLAAERGVVLCGLAGMGKTSLAADLARECAADQPVFWFTLVTGVTASAGVMLHQLALFLSTLGCQQVEPLLGRVTEADPPLPLERQLALIVDALAQRPALLCFDDAHLGREEAAIRRVWQRLRQTAPTALLLISREDLPLPELARVPLEGLELAEGLQLIAQMSQGSQAGLAIEPALGERLLSKTGGSPMLLRLAIGQMLGSHVAPGRLIDSLAVQPQVAAYLLTTVLEQLGAPAYQLATRLAVFRQPINLYDELFIELSQSEDGPYDLNSALAELQRRHLLDRPDEASLHPLLRDHLYAALVADLPRRRRLHRIAAKWSEAALGDRVEAAHHYCQAGEPASAVEVIAEQGEALANRGQALMAADVVDEILAHLRRRSKNAPDLVRRLLTLRGDLLKSTLRAGEAETNYREALALVAQSGSQPAPLIRAQIAYRLAQSLLQRGGSAEAMRLCQSAAADLAPTDRVLLARLAAVECRAHLNLSDYDEAARVATYALSLAEQLAESMPPLADGIRARGYRVLGWITYTRRPDDPAALEHFQRSLAAARRAEMRHVEAACLANIGIVYLEQGDLAAARRVLTEALAKDQTNGDSYSAAACLHNLAITLHLDGQAHAALEMLEQACTLERAVGDLDGLLSSAAQLADVLIVLGRVADAHDRLERAFAETQAAGDVWSRGAALTTLSEIQTLEGNRAMAQATARRALALPGISDNVRIQANVYNGLALAFVADGQLVAAQQVVSARPAPGVGLEIGLKRQLVEAIVALAAGDPQTAAHLATTVAERARSTGYRLAGAAAARLVRATADPPPLTQLPCLLYFDPATGPK